MAFQQERAESIKSQGVPPSQRSGVARSIHQHFAGNVSKAALLTQWLPLSITSFFVMLSAGAFLFPIAYDWRMRVISSLASPRDNPRGCWFSSFGIMLAILLAVPFAGYVARLMHAITPRLARLARLLFVLGFIQLFFAMAAQLAQPIIGLPKSHRLLAGAGGACFGIGMLCCCASVLRDRFHRFGGQRSMPRRVAVFWLSLTLVPVACLAGIGVLVLLGRHAGLAWVEDFRQSFRHTVFWQLAFWEWVGAIMAFAFLIGSVLLLPASWREKRTQPGPLTRFRVDRRGNYDPLRAG